MSHPPLDFGGRVLGRGTVAILEAMPTGLHEIGLGLETKDRGVLGRRMQRLLRDGLLEVMWRQSTAGVGGQAPNVYQLTERGRKRLEYAQAYWAAVDAAAAAVGT